jgi:hypothetical protein
MLSRHTQYRTQPGVGLNLAAGRFFGLKWKKCFPRSAARGILSKLLDAERRVCGPVSKASQAQRGLNGYPSGLPVDELFE